MNRGFRETFNVIRREVLTGTVSWFDEAKARHQCLARHTTVHSVLTVMSDETPSGWSEREALTRALIAEYQTTSLPFWASVLLVAYYPMLSRLRRRIWGILDRDDLDQLVLSSFLQVVTAFSLAAVTDRVALRLRQRTERRVFRSVRCEQWELGCRDELDKPLSVKMAALPFEKEPLGPGDPEDAVVMLIDLGRQYKPAQHLDVVTATILEKERLRSYADRLNRGREPPERVYQRLKRQRTRVVARLHKLFVTKRRNRSADSMHWGLRKPVHGGSND